MGSRHLPDLRRADPVRWRRASLLKLSAALLVVVAALAGGLMVHTGYIGGPVFAELPAGRPPGSDLRGVSAVLVSGDMGFSVGMGRQVADRLRQDGIPVVAVNSLAFFRHRRTPEEVQALISAAIRRAMALPGAWRVVLIGQSFGADMLHVGLAGLAPDQRGHVMHVVLIVPEDQVEYRASPSNVLNIGEPLLPALPTARRLDWVQTLCIRGAEETDSLCPLLSARNVAQVILPGGHPLHRDSDLVYRVVRDSIIGTARGTGRRAAHSCTWLPAIRAAA
jgi:type IV secretory pathway VirJ component